MLARFCLVVVVAAAVAYVLLARRQGAGTRASQDVARGQQPDPGKQCAISEPLFASIDTVDALSWASYRIVVGTIVERLPSAYGTMMLSDQLPNPPIYTDYVVRVEQTFRGRPIGTIRLRRAGGTLDGCADDEEGLPIVVGNRVLLFLNFPVGNSDVPPYETVGEPQGLAQVDAAGAKVYEGRWSLRSRDGSWRRSAARRRRGRSPASSRSCQRVTRRLVPTRRSALRWPHRRLNSAP